MDAEMTRLLLDQLRNGVSLTPLTWVVIAIVGLVSSCLGSYLATKGRNLATRQDTAAITKQVEEVKAAFTAQSEDHAQRNRLRLAALEKRLEVHQRAYKLWYELYWSLHTDKVEQAVLSCQDWWVQNCLYLAPEVRDALPRAWHAARNHSLILKNDRPEKSAENWSLIESCGQIILSAGLPGFTEYERAELAKAALGSAPGADL